MFCVAEIFHFFTDECQSTLGSLFNSKKEIMQTKKKNSVSPSAKAKVKKKSIAARITSNDRELLDQAVKEDGTTITDFVTGAALEKAKRVLADKQKKKMDFTMKYPNDSNFYAGKIIDNIQHIKKTSELFGGVVGSVILLAIVVNQLSK